MFPVDLAKGKRKMIANTNQQSSRKCVRIVFQVCLAITALTSTLIGETTVGIFAQGNRPTAQESSTPDAATTIFQEGRNLIANEEWAKAVEKFKELAARYGGIGQIDASLYWLAFALKKEGRLREADQILRRLEAEFPRSTWKDDARAMRIEIAPQLGNTKLVLDEVQNGDSVELRLVALQSLFESDPERALATAASILKANSGASKGLQEGAVALLGERGGEKAEPLLQEVAQSGVDTRIRVAAIVSLKNSKDEKVLSLLGDLATNSDDETIIAASLFALSQHEGERTTEILRQISLQAKTAKGRKQALYFFGMRGSVRVVESLVQMYDVENDEAIKAQILFMLSESTQKDALRKLMEVARNDPSLKLRQAAIHFLSQSTDPEAKKFVEGLIK